MNRLTEKRNGKNVLPLRNAVCGLALPYWCLEKRNEHETFISGEAVDRLAAYEDTGLMPEEILKPDKVRTGKWVLSKEYRGYAMCSSCQDSFVDPEWIAKDGKWNYCPNCGARMKGADDSE